MHVYFSGIGGSGLSAMAHFCLDLGFRVSGSDLESNESTKNLQERGATIYYTQALENIQQEHAQNPVSWFIHSPAIKQSNPEYSFCLKNNVRISKQNQLINYIIQEKSLKLIAVAGTHGKTTTTAMVVWLLKQTKMPVSWVIGSNISFGNSGAYEQNSKYLIYEADEYDRKFLELKPNAGIITSLDFDHPDTYQNQEDYNRAFVQFVDHTFDLVAVWQKDCEKLALNTNTTTKAKIFQPNELIQDTKQDLNEISLAGYHNRKNAFLAMNTVSKIAEVSIINLYEHIKSFPGTNRRMEKLLNGLYSDYAHHPVEISATIQLAREIKNKDNFKNIIIVYQPHQNIRQHSLLNEYKNCFDFANLVYWLPTYLSREDPSLKVLSPQELVSNLTTETDVEIADLDDILLKKVQRHIENQDLVVFLGAGSIDSWFRQRFL